MDLGPRLGTWGPLPRDLGTPVPGPGDPGPGTPGTPSGVPGTPLQGSQIRSQGQVETSRDGKFHKIWPNFGVLWFEPGPRGARRALWDPKFWQIWALGPQISGLGTPHFRDFPGNPRISRFRGSPDLGPWVPDLVLGRVLKPRRLVPDRSAGVTYIEGFNMYTAVWRPPFCSGRSLWTPFTV